MSARASAAWRGINIATWLPHCDLLTQLLIGFHLESMKILRIPGISATATSPSGDIPAKPAQFLRVPFSSRLHPAAIWNNLGSLSSLISLIHGPMATKRMSLHISYIPKCWTHNFAKFPTIYGGRSSYASITRDAQSCQSWAQDWSTGQI